MRAINFWEKGSYFSAPLVAVGCLFLWRNRRQPAPRAWLRGALLAGGCGGTRSGSPLSGHPPNPASVGARLMRFRSSDTHCLSALRITAFSSSLSSLACGFQAPGVPFRSVLAVAVLVALLPNPTMFSRSPHT